MSSNAHAPLPDSTSPAPTPSSPAMNEMPTVPGSYPRPTIETAEMSRLVSRLWLLTGLCLVIAAALMVFTPRRTGPTIVIHFTDGHGLKVGEALKYRGIEVGEVTAVDLEPSRRGIRVSVVLQPQAAPLARQGSEFWIERPQFRLTRVTGLETVVGAKFLGVRPGPAEGPVVREFDGLAAPPTLTEGDFQEVTVQFAEGYGLQAGDPVRHRGVIVGEVQAVELDSAQASVTVRLRLSEAETLAREGSLFWVERPKVSMTEVRGLETLVGGRYVTVAPGPSTAPSCRQFVGLDTPPVTAIPAGGLELILHAPQRWGVEPGVPVTYRGLRVGQVSSVGLSSDATRIEARVTIEARYRQLVRKNSVFWSTSGIDVSLGLTGLQLNAETLTTIAQGGIAVATPETPGEAVSSGQRFPYERVAADEWLQWRPHINLADADLARLGRLPEPLRAVVRWNERLFGFSRGLELTGWVVVLDSQRLLAPADLLLPSTAAVGDVVLEFAGRKLTLAPQSVQRLGDLALAGLTEGLPEGVTAWPQARLRVAGEPEDVVIVTGAQAPHPLSAAHLTVRDAAWDLAASTRLDPAWHGGAVLSARDGALVGLVVFHRGSPRIATLSAVP